MNHYESLFLKFWKNVVWNTQINSPLEYLAFTSQVYSSRTINDMKIVPGIWPFSKKNILHLRSEIFNYILF